MRAHGWSDTIHGGCWTFLTSVINKTGDQRQSRRRGR
jgi:hypothetical protein